MQYIYLSQDSMNKEKKITNTIFHCRWYSFSYKPCQNTRCLSLQKLLQPFFEIAILIYFIHLYQQYIL